MGKSTISMVIFSSYVKLPEGTRYFQTHGFVFKEGFPCWFWQWFNRPVDAWSSKLYRWSSWSYHCLSTAKNYAYLAYLSDRAPCLGSFLESSESHKLSQAEQCGTAFFFSYLVSLDSRPAVCQALWELRKNYGACEGHNPTPRWW